MQFLYFLYPTILALLTFSPTPTTAKTPPSKNAILLSQVKTLTLRSNAKTSHRRVSTVPQLTCQGPGCTHYTVDVLRCTNQGSSYGTEDIEWSCTASLPEEFKLGSTDVQCEGYSSSNDEYVLKGSCGVEYRLLLTEAGEEKYGSSFWGGSKSKSKTKSESADGDEGWSTGLTIIFWLMIAFFVWIIYSVYTNDPPAPRRPRQQGGFWGGGWGGGGGGGGPGGGPPYDPPPPYTRKPSSEGWRPGFWSGAAAGAAGGYMAGSRANQQQAAPVIPPSTGGSWFGGGSSGSDARRASTRRSDSGSSSSARHESTGFGSTSRR